MNTYDRERERERERKREKEKERERERERKRKRKRDRQREREREEREESVGIFISVFTSLLPPTPPHTINTHDITVDGINQKNSSCKWYPHVRIQRICEIFFPKTQVAAL